MVNKHTFVFQVFLCKSNIRSMQGRIQKGGSENLKKGVWNAALEAI